jgi:hypothetical protein
MHDQLTHGHVVFQFPALAILANEVQGNVIFLVANFLLDEFFEMRGTNRRSHLHVL